MDIAKKMKKVPILTNLAHLIFFLNCLLWYSSL